MFTNKRLLKLNNTFERNGLKATARLLNRLVKKASRQSKLMKIFGLSKEVADWIVDCSGPISVWVADQMIKEAPSFATAEAREMGIIGQDEPFAKEKVVEYLNQDFARGDPRGHFRARRQWYITPIVDWIQHPMAGGNINIRALNIEQAWEKAKEFHKELEKLVGTGDINYVEKNEIFIDYNNGFYWAKIDDNFSLEESKRMGHCGRSNRSDTLFSLRENAPFDKKHTINKSRVTVGYNSEDGKIYQSKGNKNQKPAVEYQKYIYDLVTKLPKFNGFESEYDAKTDYGIEDMSKEQVQNLHEISPQSFDGSDGVVALLKNINAPSIVIPVRLALDELFNFLDLSEATTKSGAQLQQKDIMRILRKTNLTDMYFVEGDWKKNLWRINANQKEKVYRFAMNCSVISERFKDVKELKYALSFEELLIEYGSSPLMPLSRVALAIDVALSTARAADAANKNFDNLKESLWYYGKAASLESNSFFIPFEFRLSSIMDYYDRADILKAFEERDEWQNKAWHVLFKLIRKYPNKPKLRLATESELTIDNTDFNTNFEFFRHNLGQTT